MNKIYYRGYAIEVDVEDKGLSGQVLGVRPIIVAEAPSVPALKRRIGALIKLYEADCVKEGISPQPPATGRLFLRLSPEVHQRAKAAAQRRGQSLNRWGAEALDRASRGAR